MEILSHLPTIHQFFESAGRFQTLDCRLKQVSGAVYFVMQVEIGGPEHIASRACNDTIVDHPIRPFDLRKLHRNEGRVIYYPPKNRGFSSGRRHHPLIILPVQSKKMEEQSDTSSWTSIESSNPEAVAYKDLTGESYEEEERQNRFRRDNIDDDHDSGSRDSLKLPRALSVEDLSSFSTEFCKILDKNTLNEDVTHLVDKLNDIPPISSPVAHEERLQNWLQAQFLATVTHDDNSVREHFLSAQNKTEPELPQLNNTKVNSSEPIPKTHVDKVEKVYPAQTSDFPFDFSALSETKETTPDDDENLAPRPIPAEVGPLYLESPGPSSSVGSLGGLIIMGAIENNISRIPSRDYYDSDEDYFGSGEEDNQLSTQYCLNSRQCGTKSVDSQSIDSEPSSGSDEETETLKYRASEKARVTRDLYYMSSDEEISVYEWIKPRAFEAEFGPQSLGISLVEYEWPSDRSGDESIMSVFSLSRQLRSLRDKLQNPFSKYSLGKYAKILFQVTRLLRLRLRRKLGKLLMKKLTECNREEVCKKDNECKTNDGQASIGEKTKKSDESAASPLGDCDESDECKIRRLVAAAENMTSLESSSEAQSSNEERKSKFSANSEHSIINALRTVDLRADTLWNVLGLQRFYQCRTFRREHWHGDEYSLFTKLKDQLREPLVFGDCVQWVANEIAPEAEYVPKSIRGVSFEDGVSFIGVSEHNNRAWERRNSVFSRVRGILKQEPQSRVYELTPPKAFQQEASFEERGILDRKICRSILLCQVLSSYLKTDPSLKVYQVTLDAFSVCADGIRQKYISVARKQMSEYVCFAYNVKKEIFAFFHNLVGAAYEFSEFLDYASHSLESASTLEKAYVMMQSLEKTVTMSGVLSFEIYRLIRCLQNSIPEYLSAMISIANAGISSTSKILEAYADFSEVNYHDFPKGARIRCERKLFDLVKESSFVNDRMELFQDHSLQATIDNLRKSHELTEEIRDCFLEQIVDIFRTISDRRPKLEDDDLPVLKEYVPIEVTSSYSPVLEFEDSWTPSTSAGTMDSFDLARLQDTFPNIPSL